MQVYRTKITVAFASDTPTGLGSKSSAQTVAKITIANASNVGNYTATVETMNFGISTSVSNTADRELKVYKDSVGTTALATTQWLAAGNQNFGNTAITTFTDVEISAGATKTFYVTLDTTDASTNNTLSINVEANDVIWGDGSSTGITNLYGLPLTAKTISY